MSENNYKSIYVVYYISELWYIPPMVVPLFL
jgi:hypothetical protein